MTELVAYAKANPGKLSYGHGNNVGQDVGEVLKRRTGVDIVRVRYRSNPAGVTDLIAGTIEIMIPDFNTWLAHAEGGRILPLAVLNQGAGSAAAECAFAALDSVARLRHSALLRAFGAGGYARLYHQQARGRG